MTAMALAVAGCDLLPERPPTDTAPVRFDSVWVRHLKDKHDRESSALIGFTLRDAANRPVAASGMLEVELRWNAAAHRWTAEGRGELRSRDFSRAKSKPVPDGTWYAEPWSIYLIGGDYPGPSKYGYEVSLKLTTREDETLVWRRRHSVSP